MTNALKEMGSEFLTEELGNAVSEIEKPAQYVSDTSDELPSGSKAATHNLPKSIPNSKGRPKTSAAELNCKPKNFIIVTFPTHNNGDSKVPSKSYPKLQERFASYDTDVFQTHQDIVDLERAIEREKAKIKKAKESLN